MQSRKMDAITVEIPNLGVPTELRSVIAVGI